jgi:branched-chain amino acid transport system substrate-binding protein
VSINHKKFGALLGIVAIAIAIASTAGAARQSTPGVTSSSITIGSTFPLSEKQGVTGGASLYQTIAYAEQAYYHYVGKVNGRKITDIVDNDQYDPSETVPEVQNLVEQKHVFAIVGSLGTTEGVSTMNYLNSHQVPQVLLATGDSLWGLCSETGAAFHPINHVCSSPQPWTMGWQPDYNGEGYLYGKYLLAHKSNPKIGVLYQDDLFGQNYLAGLKKGLGSHTGDIVHTEAYASGESPSQISTRVEQIYAHGANVLVVFATPGSAIAALSTASAIPGWKPMEILSNVSANRVFMLAAEDPKNGAAKLNGLISSTYVKSETATPASDKGMVLAHKIIWATGNANLKQEYALGDTNLIYGLGVAWTFVDALKHAGKNPTRASFMKAIRSLNESGANKNPFLFPGMTVKTSKTNTFPMQQLNLERWAGQTAHAAGDWTKVGGIAHVGH